MSDFSVDVVRVGPVGPVENADKLEKTEVYGYPCLIPKGSLKEGDKAVYIAVDSVVPTSNPAFSFLSKKDKHRIKAIRLRGTFSMGLLMSAETLGITDEVGADVAEKLGIEKYEEPVRLSGGECVSGPGVLSPVYKVNHFLRYGRESFVPGEQVVVTEKIHGGNARFCFDEEKNEVFVGSHRVWKDQESNNIYAQAFRKYPSIETVVKQFPLVLYGEVYGPVQDLKYGSPNEVQLVIFDALNYKTGKYLDSQHLLRLCETYELPTPTVLYQGPFEEKAIKELASGPTTMYHGKGDHHFREGVVVRPVEDRLNDKGMRVLLKVISEEYLLRKGGTEHH